MKWQEIEISKNRKSFEHKGKKIFQKKYLSVLEFQDPGIACVQTKKGWFHIDKNGIPIYSKVFKRVFGFYFNRSSVIDSNSFYHIGINGLPAYKEKFKWCGNFQEKLCIVKDFENYYFHIGLDGKYIYKEKYVYAGDYREGVACVCLENGMYTHIDVNGDFLYNGKFEMLDVFHKGFARAKDHDGWFHIDRSGEAIYGERYLSLEPFYNGYAFAVLKNGRQIILSESGNIIPFAI